MMIPPQGTGSGGSGFGVKITFSVVFILATLAVVSVLLLSFVNKVFDSNREELYNYLMHTGIVACAISVIKFNLLSVGGLKLQITDIEEPIVKKATPRRAPCFDQASDSSDDEDSSYTPAASRKPEEITPYRADQLARCPISRAHKESMLSSTSRATQEGMPSTSRAPQGGLFGSSSESPDDKIPTGSEDERRSPIKTRSQAQRDIELRTPQYSHSKAKGKGKGLKRK